MKQFIFVLSLLFLFACTPQTYDKPNYDLVGTWEVSEVTSDETITPELVDAVVIFTKDTFFFYVPETKTESAFTVGYRYYGDKLSYLTTECRAKTNDSFIEIIEEANSSAALRQYFNVPAQKRAVIRLVKKE